MISTRPINLEKLNERQKQCLRHYYRGLEAKEIARELGISPYTVNEHLRDARRILGVSRSVQAARLLAEAENLNPIGNNPRRVAEADRADQNGRAATPEASGAPVRKSRYPLSTLQRLGLIIAIAFLAVALGGALVAAADTITHLTRVDRIDISDPPYRK